MPWNENNFDRRGGNNYGIVLCCPNLVADQRLVYLDMNRESGGWVIRDFIGDSVHDSHTAGFNFADIEADATNDEFPPWRNVEDVDAWRTYLTMRTSAVFRTH